MFCNSKGRVIALLLVMMVFIGIPFVSFADGSPDFDRDCTLRITLKDPKTQVPLNDIGFTLYRVASVQQGAGGLRYAYTAAFSDNGMPLVDLQAEGLAEHLAAYAQQELLTGASAAADANGAVQFSMLSEGLYLAVQHDAAEGYYPVRPFLVTLPMKSADGDAWLYDVDASPKTGLLPELPQTTRLTVTKRWEDTDASGLPKSVTVVLCRDGVPFETVLLQATDGWTHTWEALDAAHVWAVSEIAIPDGYTVRYETAVQSITIVNSRIPIPTPTPTPPPLVQTGHRYRTVAWIAAAGLVLLGAGFWFVAAKKRQ